MPRPSNIEASLWFSPQWSEINSTILFFFSWPLGCTGIGETSQGINEVSIQVPSHSCCTHGSLETMQNDTFSYKNQLFIQLCCQGFVKTILVQCGKIRLQYRRTVCLQTQPWQASSYVWCLMAFSREPWVSTSVTLWASRTLKTRGFSMDPPTARLKTVSWKIPGAEMVRSKSCSMD